MCALGEEDAFRMHFCSSTLAAQKLLRRVTHGIATSDPSDIMAGGDCLKTRLATPSVALWLNTSKSKS